MKKNSKVVVIGLDGFSHSLLSSLTEKGLMSTTASIITQSNLSRMSVSIPEISAVSWTSFMTGTNPGTHGIFGFTDLKANSYKMSFPLYTELTIPTIWDRLGSLGKRSVVINQPATYPARRIEGAMISGFVAVDLFKAVSPSKYIGSLRKKNYMIDIDTEKCRYDHELLFRELHQTLESRRYAVDLLWKSESWDYFEVVVTGTDRLHHYAWDIVNNENHPDYDKVVQYYQAVDQMIGEIVDRFQKTRRTKNIWDHLFLLSDHGFCGLDTEFIVNAWLKQEGFLSLEKDGMLSLDDISRGSQAFALDPGRIYINKENRFPKGSVLKHNIEHVKDQIKEKLRNIHFNGKKVVEQVIDCRDIYSGPYIESGPDLIIQTVPGFDCRASLQETRTFRKTDLKGMHTANDAFYIGTSLPTQPLHIEHLAQILLQKY